MSQVQDYTDVMKRFGKWGKHHRNTKGPARQDKVYQEVRAHPEFQEHISRLNEKACRILKTAPLKTAVLVATCKSGSHRSVALIRSLGEFLATTERPVDVLQIDSARLSSRQSEELSREIASRLSPCGKQA